MTEETLDTSGLKCPLPVLKAGKRLRAMAPGAVLRVVATDRASIIDMPHFCAQSGHRYLGLAEEGGALIHRIARG